MFKLYILIYQWKCGIHRALPVVMLGEPNKDNGE